MNNFRVKGCLVTLVPCTVWIIENTKTFARLRFLKIPSRTFNVSNQETHQNNDEPKSHARLECDFR